MSKKIGFSDRAEAVVHSKRSTESGLALHGHVKAVCRDKDGNVKWIEEGSNIVVDTGIDYIMGTAVLDTATLYLGLLTATPSPVAGWTMTQAAAAEAAGYSSGTRPAWGQGAVSSKVVTNGTAVTFTMDGTDTSIGGAFLTTNATKDDTGGTLVAAKAFSENKAVGNGDTLDVTYTITGSSI
jgi:hypothetical protein